MTTIQVLCAGLAFCALLTGVAVFLNVRGGEPAVDEEDEQPGPYDGLIQSIRRAGGM